MRGRSAIDVAQSLPAADAVVIWAVAWGVMVGLVGLMAVVCLLSRK